MRSSRVRRGVRQWEPSPAMPNIVVYGDDDDDDNNLRILRLRKTAQSTGITNHVYNERPVTQALKCNGTQGNAVPPPPIYDSKRSPTSDCYNARERHTTIVRGPDLNVAFPHLNAFMTNSVCRHKTDNLTGSKQILYNSLVRTGNA